MPGRLSGVDHVAVLVADIDEALPQFVDGLGLVQVSDETLFHPAVRLVHLDAGNVDVQLVQPLGAGKMADLLHHSGPGLHHVCFGVARLTDTLAALGESLDGVFSGGRGRPACFLSGESRLLDIELMEFGDADAYGSLAPATDRVVAYWADECRRDLTGLMTHFSTDAEVVTPEGRYVGKQEIEALYRESFEAYPELQVDAVNTYAARGSYCFEFVAVLTDASARTHLVEGVNVVTLRDGLIAYMRSYENSPQPIGKGDTHS